MATTRKARTGTLRRLKPRPLEPDLARVVRRLLKETGSPGVAVGVLHRGRAYAQGFGITNVQAPAPVDVDTLFQIGSTGKTFTASAVMRLVDQGRIDLEAPARRYVKDLRTKDPDVGRRVTVRHLLTHTAGWAGDFFPDTGRGEDALAAGVAKIRTIPQLTPLGEVWHYNNAGFYLLGRVIERVTRKPYETAIKELLLDPLGMTRSFFFAEEAVVHRVVAGHVTKGKRQVVMEPWWMPRTVFPAGGLISDVVDQLRWAWFHLGDGRAPDGARLLKARTLREMQRPQAPAGNLADSVGLSWLLEDVDGVRLVSHGGTTHGQLSAFTMVPERDFAVTVLSNSFAGRAVNKAVVAWALDRYADVRPTPPVVREDVTAEELRQFEGAYREAFGEAEIHVKPVGRRLSARMIALIDGDDGKLPAFHLSLIDADRAVQLDGDLKGYRVEFLRGPTGRVAWMRFGGRLYRRTRPKMVARPKAR